MGFDNFEGRFDKNFRSARLSERTSTQTMRCDDSEKHEPWRNGIWAGVRSNNRCGRKRLQVSGIKSRFDNKGACGEMGGLDLLSLPRMLQPIPTEWITAWTRPQRGCESAREIGFAFKRITESITIFCYPAFSNIVETAASHRTRNCSRDYCVTRD